MSQTMKRLLWLFIPEDSTHSSSTIDWCGNDYRCWGMIKVIIWSLGAISMGVVIGRLA
jgi:hypothetical protein